MNKIELNNKIQELFKFDSKRCSDIAESLFLEQDTICRHLMEDSIDDMKKSIVEKLYPGEENIHNAKIDELERRVQGYSLFVQNLEEEIDEREGTRVQRTSKL